MTSSRGFTLIEILVVLGMLALLSTVVLVAVNPLRQFAQARNTQREAHVSAILNAVGHRLADNRGIFESESDECTDTLPSLESTMGSMSGYNIRPCLVPDYIAELPHDPEEGSNTCETIGCFGAGEDYATGYTISQNASTSRVTVCAPHHAEETLPGSEPFCLTR